MKKCFFLMFLLLSLTLLPTDKEDGSPVQVMQSNDAPVVAEEPSLAHKLFSHLSYSFAGWCSLGFAGFYVLYTYVCSRSQLNSGQAQEINEETLTVHDQEILKKFTVDMAMDLQQIKDGRQGAAIESFTFDQMDNKQLAQEVDMVKRSFVYICDQCAVNEDNIEALEAFCSSITQEVEQMCVL